MARKLGTSSLLPSGFIIETTLERDSHLEISVRPRQTGSACPSCGRSSRSIHSHYWRKASDLPLGGRRVRLLVKARRFRCNSVLCGQKIFAERVEHGVLAPWARRTQRLNLIVHHLGLALGGRPASRFADRLMVPVSKDTLIRTVRRFGTPSPIPPRVIGIDDWAWRRNHRYGTLICDLERRRPIKLLPDREPATAQAWLSHQGQVEIVARDRGGGYGLAISRGLPQAVQVADRWHLMENASRAFLEAVRKSMRLIRRSIGVTRIDPELLTAAEKIQYEGFLRREDTSQAVMALFNDGISIKEIVRRTGHSRGLVRQITRGVHTDVFRTRESSLEPYLEWLDSRWEKGDRNGADLWRRLRRRGFKGSLRVVGEWATRRRRAEQTDAALRRIPSARTIARFMTTGRDRLTKSETVIVAAIEANVPHLVAARSQLEAFHAMIRTRNSGGLADWLERSSQGLMASFAKGVQRDRAAVEAAVTSTWSNGQTEGQITKLKLVKRQMYGRGKIDLLEARLVGAP